LNEHTFSDLQWLNFISEIAGRPMKHLEQWFPTGMPQHPRCHLRYSGVPRANAFFNISSKTLFSKCHQTLKQIALGSLLRAHWVPLIILPSVGCRKSEKVVKH